jgi:hypothetical protein
MQYLWVRETYRVLLGKSEGKNHLQDQGVDGRIQLRSSGSGVGGKLSGFIWLRIRTGGWHF